MRPVIGEVMRVKDSSSSAVLTLASATFTAAWASRTRFSRSSKDFSEMTLLRGQRLAAHDVEIGVRDLDWRLQQLGLRLLQRALEGPRVDHEQQVALLDVLAVLEMDLGEVAGDAGAQSPPSRWRRSGPCTRPTR